MRSSCRSTSTVRWRTASPRARSPRSGFRRLARGGERAPQLQACAGSDLPGPCLTAAADQQVGGLDVAMDDPGVVRGIMRVVRRVERIGDLDRERQQQIDLERPAADAKLQRRPFEQLLARRIYVPRDTPGDVEHARAAVPGRLPLTGAADAVCRPHWPKGQYERRTVRG